ncbi:MAG: hypothetical protein ACH6QP_00565 [Candidatus Carsonella ruddii]
MKNYLIKIRYGIFFNFFLNFLNKINNKRKNIFILKTYFYFNFIYNINIKKNLFFYNNYLFFKILIICGGDGSFINGIKDLINKNIYVKFLNFGKIGFLSNSFKKNFFIKNYIGNIIIFDKKIKYSFVFINEILFKKKKNLIKIKKKIYLIEFLLISTSLGSTGYFYSEKNIQFKINYLSLSFVLSHTNNKFVFFFKKIKIKIKSITNIIIDENLKFLINNYLIIILIKKNFFLKDLIIKIYDK